MIWQAFKRKYLKSISTWESSFRVWLQMLGS